jgi:hypothetical protein
MDVAAWARHVDAEYHRQYARTEFSATFLAAANLQRLVESVQRRVAQHVNGALLELDADLARVVLDFATEQSAHTFLPPSAAEANHIFVERYMRDIIPRAYDERRHARFLREAAELHGGETFHQRQTAVRGEIERPVESTQRHIGADMTDYMLNHPYGQPTPDTRADACAPAYHRAQHPAASAFAEEQAASTAWWPDVQWRAS